MQYLLVLALSVSSTVALALQPRDLPIISPPDGLAQADAAQNCARWDLMGDPGPMRCSEVLAQRTDITYDDLVLWNPSIGPLCDNVWRLYYLCTLISGPYIPHNYPKPAGVPVNPAPAVPISGNTSATNCDRWDVIVPGSSCQTFMSRYPGLTKSELQMWNPRIITVQDTCFLKLAFDLCTSVVGHVDATPQAIEAPVM